MLKKNSLPKTYPCYIPDAVCHCVCIVGPHVFVELDVVLAGVLNDTLVIQLLVECLQSGNILRHPRVPVGYNLLIESHVEVLIQCLL